MERARVEGEADGGRACLEEEGGLLEPFLAGWEVGHCVSGVEGGVSEEFKIVILLEVEVVFVGTKGLQYVVYRVGCDWSLGQTPQVRLRTMPLLARQFYAGQPSSMSKYTNTSE